MPRTNDKVHEMPNNVISTVIMLFLFLHEETMPQNK